MADLDDLPVGTVEFWDELSERREKLSDAILSYLHEQGSGFVFMSEFYDNYFQHTTGNYITSGINQAIDKLEGLGLVKSHNRRDVLGLTDEGKRLFAELSPNELDKPFTTYFEKIVTKKSNEALLIGLQIQANRSAISTNNISRVTNLYIAIFTGAAALWYSNDLLDKVLPNFIYKYCVIRAVISLALCFGIFGIVRIIRQHHRANRELNQLG